MPHVCKCYQGIKVLVLGRSRLFHFLKNKTNDHASKKSSKGQKNYRTEMQKPSSGSTNKNDGYIIRNELESLIHSVPGIV